MALHARWIAFLLFVDFCLLIPLHQYGKKILLSKSEERTGIEVLQQAEANGSFNPEHQKVLLHFDETKSISIDHELSLEMRKNIFNLLSKIEDDVHNLLRNTNPLILKMKENKTIGEMEPHLNDLSNRQKTILVNLHTLLKLNRDWRSTSLHARDTAQKLQMQLYQLQNPSKCDQARKLVCSTEQDCGFGCQAHHLVYCFMLAYWTGRTLVVESKDWSYANGKGWEGAFLPLSDTCISAEGAVLWSADHSSHQVVSLPTITSVHPRPTFMPPAVPREFADKVFTFHSNPFLWFVGQFLAYMMRPNKQLQQYIEEKRKNLYIPSPYASIQLRRTDKIKGEAKSHDIDEYMVHIEDWYELRRKDIYRQVGKKRVYIATDDPNVIEMAKEKYKEYDVYADKEIMQSTKTHSKQPSLDSLFGMVYDVHMLAESDFMVCTLDSDVDQLAYELMQTYHIDARQKAYSLDNGYYFNGQDPSEVKAI